MRSLGVVAVQPGGGQLPDLAERSEDVGVEDFGAVRPVESLDEGVLGRLPGLDVAQVNAASLTPRGQRERGEFRAVVDAQMLRCTVERDQLLEDSGCSRRSH